MTGYYLELMIYRALTKRSAPVWAAILGAGALGVGLTALLEATWYALVRHYDFWDVLGANIDPDMFPRPMVYVAAAGAITLAVYAGRALLNWRASRRLVAAE